MQKVDIEEDETQNEKGKTITAQESPLQRAAN